MGKIPFLKPNLVKFPQYERYLRAIDESRLYSNFGPLVNEFERRIVDEYFGGRGHFVTAANATLSLIMAIEHMKRPGGKYALMPSFTFAATPQAALWCGLEPLFVDIDPGDWFASETLISETVAKYGDEIAVVVPYATFGSALDLRFYQNLIDDGLPVVVDAAASFGVTVPNSFFGDSFAGAIVFSFHATKSFGIGEGGGTYTSNPEFAKALKQSTNFGFSEEKMSVQKGMNAKLAEYSAAIGLATLDVYQEKLATRESLFRRYHAGFDDAGLLSQGWRLHQPDSSNVRQFVSLLAPDDTDPERIALRLKEKGVEVRRYFAPACHDQPHFRSCVRTDLTVTKAVSSRILSLPLWEDMSERQIDQVVVGVQEALTR